MELMAPVAPAFPPSPRLRRTSRPALLEGAVSFCAPRPGASSSTSRVDIRRRRARISDHPPERLANVEITPDRIYAGRGRSAYLKMFFGMFTCTPTFWSTRRSTGAGISPARYVPVVPSRTEPSVIVWLQLDFVDAALVHPAVVGPQQIDEHARARRLRGNPDGARLVGEVM